MPLSVSGEGPHGSPGPSAPHPLLRDWRVPIRPSLSAGAWVRIQRVKEVDMRRPRLSYANVTATLALVLATSGAGYAAAVKIPRNSVGSPQVINDSLKGRDIK